MTAMRLKRYQSPSGGFALGKMGVGATMLKQGKTAKDYVQDGLIALWDGIENAGWGKHDANATVWKNLAGEQYDCALSGAIFDDNSLVAKSTGQVATASSYPSSSNNGYTIELIFRYEGGGNCVAKFGSWQFWRERAGVYYFYPSYNIPGLSGNYAPIADESVPNSASFVLSPDGRQTYCNGKPQSGGKKDYWSTQVLQFFGRNNSFSVGHIYGARVYNKSLTAEEIARNYAIDKERFNLP